LLVKDQKLRAQQQQQQGLPPRPPATNAINAFKQQQKFTLFVEQIICEPRNFWVRDNFF
jgi:hypothetical protein